MTSALANIFLGEDRVVESGILDDLHKRFPLNSRALDVSAFDHDESERIRLRRTIQALEEAGIRTEGLEPSQAQSEWHVGLIGNLAREGHLKNNLQVRLTERAAYPMAMETILQTTQMVLQSQGFAAIIDRCDNMVVLKNGVNKLTLPWIELALGTEIDGMTAQEAERWISADARFGDYNTLEGWYATGLPLEKAQEWISKTRKDTHSGTDFVWHSAHHAEAWISAGYDVESATQWAETGSRMNYYSYAKDWIDSGLTPRETTSWIKLVGDGYNGGFAQAEELRKRGITHTMAKQLARLDFRSKSHQIAPLIDGGMKVKEVMRWAEVGAENFSSRQIEYWSKLGFSPEDISAWFKMAREFGCSRSFSYQNAAESWINAGLGVDDARPWVQVDARFASYELVKEWSDLGLTPADAKPWTSITSNNYHYSDFTYVNNVLEWQEIHPCFYNPNNVAKLVNNNITPAQAKAMLQVLGEKALAD